MKIGSIFLRGKTKAEGQVLFSQSMIGRVLLSFTENTAQTLKGICLFTGGHILFESSHTYFLKKYFFQYLSYQRSLVILYQYNIQVSIQVSNFVILFFSYVNNEKNMSLPMLALHQFSTWLFSYPFFSFLSLSILHISRSVQNLPYLKARLYFLQISCQYGSSRFKHLRKKKKQNWASGFLFSLVAESLGQASGDYQDKMAETSQGRSVRENKACECLWAQHMHPVSVWKDSASNAVLNKIKRNKFKDVSLAG